MDKSKYIKEIISNAADKRESNGKTIYLFYKDKEVPVFLKFIGKSLCQILDTAISDITWQITTIESFYNNYIKNINKILEIVEVSKRKWGQDRLDKPNDLKGIKPIFSIKMNGRKNPVFIKNYDVWIKANDYFSTDISQEEATRRGIDFNARNRFIYNDNFSSVTLRGEGWIKIQNLLFFINDRDICTRIKRKVCELYNWEYPQMSTDWENFYSSLIIKLKDWKKRNLL